MMNQTKSQSKPIMAKDRFFLKKRFDELKQLDKENPKYQQLAENYQTLLEKSQTKTCLSVGKPKPW